MKRYHCFWLNPYGDSRVYAAHDDLSQVYGLVKENALEDGRVRDLKVVFGDLLEFEPATYVASYRVKESD